MLYDKGLLIDVDKTRCLNYQHNDVGCNHCVSHCPGQAIFLNKNLVFLEKEKCLGCGLCFSDCPTQVFTALEWDETTITKEIKFKPTPVVQFFCGYNDKPFLGKEEKDKGAIQIPTCLSSISKGAWYEIGLHTNVELRLEKCRQCQMKQCVERLQLTIETAIEWLLASGHTTAFSYIHYVENIQEKKSFKAVSTGMKVTSRRDLFLSLFNQGKSVVSRIRERDFTLHGKRDFLKKGSLLPNWQKRLEKNYTSHFQEGGNPAYWPSIEKNSDCVNCGMCSKRCPTQALQTIIKNGKAVHTFNSGHCLDCRICMLFCPTESITRYRQPNSNPFETQIIYEAPVSECRYCGDPIFANRQDLCYWCEHEATDDAMISDVFNNMSRKLL